MLRDPGGIQYKLDSSGNPIGLVGPNGVISIPSYTFHASGTIAAPVSTLVCTASQGKFGLPANMRIPANTLKAGSKIVIQFKLNRQGTFATTDNIYCWLGTGNGSSDKAVITSPNTGTVFPPQSYVFMGDVDITGSNIVYATQQSFIPNVGQSQAGGELTDAAINTAADMFLNFGITVGTPTANTNTYALQSYSVQVYS